MTTSLLAMQNGSSASFSQLPHLEFSVFSEVVIGACASGRRVSALFGAPMGEDLALFVVLADDRLGVLECGWTLLTSDAFSSMTPRCHQVHLFEREIAEQWGVTPKDHPWLKPVRYHASYRAGRDVWARDVWGGPEGTSPRVGITDFFQVQGDEIHELAVGPVHAGVIEPGHFRFQCHGEHVYHLEISLGYQHRGVEQRLVGGPGKRSIHYAETLAGDTTVGHTTAYCQILEALGGERATPAGYALRGIALELERLANHTGDLGALASDVGFLPTASFCGRLRGDFLNMTAALCGSRFGRGLVRPGGVAFDADENRLADLRARLEAAASDVKDAVQLLWASPSVMARFEDTGRVTADLAIDLGLVGPAARASGLRRDVRETHPVGIFQETHIPVSTAETGDVLARAQVRYFEIERSIEFLRAQLSELPSGPVRHECPPPQRSQFAVSLVEGWRGEICHVAMTDELGHFSAYKVVDPSFHNWAGLTMALRDQQISDFPLCNKSFNLSYCGHDL